MLRGGTLGRTHVSRGIHTHAMAAGRQKALRFGGEVRAASCSAHHLREGKSPGMRVRLNDGVLGLLPSFLPSFLLPSLLPQGSRRTARLGCTQSILPDPRSPCGPGEDFSDQKDIYPSRQRPYKSWWLKATIGQIQPRNLAHVLTVSQGVISNCWASCG